MVLHKITWPNELVYNSGGGGGEITAYDDLSTPLFVSGYLAMMEMDKESIKPLMALHLHDSWPMRNFMDGSQSELFMPSNFSRWKMTESGGMMQRPSFSFAMPWSGIKVTSKAKPRVWWATQHRRIKQGRMVWENQGFFK